MKTETATAVGRALGEVVAAPINGAVLGAFYWAGSDAVFMRAWALGCAVSWLVAMVRTGRKT